MRIIEMYEDAVEVRLDEEEWAVALDCGTRRRQYHDAKGSLYKPVFQGKNYKLTGIPFERATTGAEIAVIKYLGLDRDNCGWFGFSENPSDWKAPDILGAVQVKMVIEPQNPLCVFPEDIEEDVLSVKVWLDQETDVFYVMGWIRARDLIGNWVARTPEGYYRATLLKSPEGLSEALAGRLGGVAA